jgi:hypothetical protein
METSKGRRNLGGRPPIPDPCRHRYSFNLNDTDNAKFLAMFDASGMREKARFITSVLFGREIKVVKIDKAAMDYYMRLTTFHSQMRAIGNNYNQVVLALKSNFSSVKALAYLYKLEKATKEVVAIHQKVMDLTEEFERKWLQKGQ